MHLPDPSPNQELPVRYMPLAEAMVPLPSCPGGWHDPLLYSFRIYKAMVPQSCLLYKPPFPCWFEITLKYLDMFREALVIAKNKNKNRKTGKNTNVPQYYKISWYIGRMVFWGKKKCMVHRYRFILQLIENHPRILSSGKLRKLKLVTKCMEGAQFCLYENISLWLKKTSERIGYLGDGIIGDICLPYYIFMYRWNFSNYHL